MQRPQKVSAFIVFIAVVTVLALSIIKAYFEGMAGVAADKAEKYDNLVLLLNQCEKEHETKCSLYPIPHKENGLVIK